MIKSLYFVSAVGLACVALVCADMADDLLQGRKRAALLLDSHEGYDLHKDHFYFDDKLVEKAYKRSEYTSTKITMAGQKPDITGHQVPEAVNPFIVAQKSIAPLGSSADRWDVKEDEYKNQYLGLFHGDGFVVNKLRGQLLRRLVNTVQDYLPILDAAKPDTHSIVESHVVEVISKLVTDLDTQIRDSMKDKDASSATGTVVIVTQKNLILINVGTGKVLAYDDTSLTTDLTAKSYDSNGQKFCQTFGNTKRHLDFCTPFVEVVPREMPDTSEDAEEGDVKSVQFLVLETPAVAEMVSDGVVESVVMKQINQHKLAADHEQEMFSSAVTGVIKSAEDSINMFQKWKLADATVMLVALEKNYRNIH